MILTHGKGYTVNQDVLYLSNLLFSNLIICFLRQKNDNVILFAYL